MSSLAVSCVYASIVAGTDGGPAGDAAVRQATVLARNHGAALQVIRAEGPGELSGALRRVAARQRVDAVVVARAVARSLSGRIPCDLIAVDAPAEIAA